MFCVCFYLIFCQFERFIKQRIIEKYKDKLIRIVIIDFIYLILIIEK